MYENRIESENMNGKKTEGKERKSGRERNDNECNIFFSIFYLYILSINIKNVEHVGSILFLTIIFLLDFEPFHSTEILFRCSCVRIHFFVGVLATGTGGGGVENESEKLTSSVKGARRRKKNNFSHNTHKEISLICT